LLEGVGLNSERSVQGCSAGNAAHGEITKVSREDGAIRALRWTHDANGRCVDVDAHSWTRDGTISSRGGAQGEIRARHARIDGAFTGLDDRARSVRGVPARYILTRECSASVFDACVSVIFDTQHSALRTSLDAENVEQHKK
jgi:hypothetical protein